MDYSPPPKPPIEICYDINSYNFVKEPNKTQYKGSDYSGALRVERGISLERAFEIANADPEIDYFVYVKGCCMVLEIPPNVDFDPELDPLGLVEETTIGYCRIFRKGDVVFFRHEGKWLGTAPGLADVYSKRDTICDN